MVDQEYRVQMEDLQRRERKVCNITFKREFCKKKIEVHFLRKINFLITGEQGMPGPPGPPALTTGVYSSDNPEFLSTG